MTPTITKRLTKTNKGKKGDNTPEWIIVHFVGASGQAEDNADYFLNLYRGASAQYFVDPKSIFQVVEDDTPAWHIGDGHRTRKGKHNGYVHKGGATNTNSIGIEGCQDTSTGKDVWNWEFHPDTVANIEWLVRQKQKQYNIDDDHVIRHYDASGKLCPGNWSDNDWKQWKEFKKRLELDIVQPSPSASPKPEGKSEDSHMYLIKAGDTLSSIAKEHKVTITNLVKWNDLKNKNLIFPETKIIVSEPKVEVHPEENDIEKMARDVLAGKYGNGAEREKKLGANYDAVQEEINNILLNKKPAPQPKSVDQLAREVLDGKWGSGDERKKKLGDRFEAVQKRVNELSSAKAKTSTAVKVAPVVAPTSKTITRLAREVMDGKHGKGDNRKKSLGSNYDEVQALVNKLVKGGAVPSKSVDQLADEVIAGKHGNGMDRIKSLGTNYAAVQVELNRRARRK